MAREKNPNENCLEGKKCPKCSSYGPFEVHIDTYMEVHDDGTEIDKCADVNWEDDSHTRCLNCGYEDYWEMFDDPPPKRHHVETADDDRRVIVAIEPDGAFRKIDGCVDMTVEIRDYEKKTAGGRLHEDADGEEYLKHEL